MEKPYNNEEEGRREYSVNWIKACLFRYLQGKTDESSVRRDIESARRYGVTRNHIQIIIESLPFDRLSERFKLLLKLLRTVWK